MSNDISSARYWSAVLYPENMIDIWESDIGDIIQLPYAYCLHDLDRDSQSEHRKDHVHIILAWPNTTTKKHAHKVFDSLSAPGKTCLSTLEAVIHIRGMYDYLIHDTETCKKKGKFLYPSSARVTGNNFDIGAYEQLGVAEKNAIIKDMCNVIIENEFINFGDFYIFVINNFEDTNYFDCLKTYSGLFERLTKSNFQKWQMSLNNY